MPVINILHSSLPRRQDQLSDDKEINASLSFMLNKVRELYPQVAKELTKKVKVRKDLNKLERKRYKVQFLQSNYREVFDALVRVLRSEFSTTHDPLSYSSSGLYDSVYFLEKTESVSGSYGTKYSHGQNVIEE